MMENAGRHLAGLARDRFLDGDPRARTVTVVCGSGGNGGGGLVAARRLHGWGADVRVRLASPAVEFAGVPGRQLDTVRRLAIPVEHRSDRNTPSSGALKPELVLDALVGYGLKRRSGEKRRGSSRR